MSGDTDMIDGHELTAHFDCAACARPVESADPLQLRTILPTAQRVRQEALTFSALWPNEPGEQAPAFSWEAVARQLKDLAGSRGQADIVDGLLASIRRWAPLKPPEMVLRELLCLASVVIEEPSQS